MSFEVKLINHACQKCVTPEPNQEGPDLGSSLMVIKARWWHSKTVAPTSNREEGEQGKESLHLLPLY